MTFILDFFKTLMICVALLYSYGSYQSQKELHRELNLVIVQTRKETEGRIAISQAKTLTMLSDVSRGTQLLAIILCKQSYPAGDCDTPLKRHPEQPTLNMETKTDEVILQPNP